MTLHRGCLKLISLKRSWPCRLATLLCLLAGSIAVSAQTVSVEIYDGRLRQIQETLGELAQRGEEAEEVRIGLAQLRATIPPMEEIASEGVRLRVDNQWLIREIDTILQLDPGAGERQSRLSELEFRLGRLRRLMLSSTSVPPVPEYRPDYRAEREALQSIISGPDYRPEEVRESSLRRWLTRLKDSLVSLFRQLLPGSLQREPHEVADQLSTFQKIVLLIAIPLAIYLLYRILAGYRIRRHPRPLTASQEILGEMITPDLTPRDLLARASQLAQTGQHRQAIRLSFIASILELARHEILEVHPTRTNRDYLKALPSRSEIIPVFTILTSLFEDFWYGERPANAEDYDHFETLVGNLVDLLERDTTGKKSPSRLNATA
jgi:hypothetical protein